MSSATRILLLLCFAFVGWISMAMAQEQTAITLDGKDIVLYPNGQWKYRETSQISVNPGTPSKKLFKGRAVPYGLQVDESKWVQKRATTEGHEFYFVHTDGDIYATTIPERIEIPKRAFKDIIIENAKSAGAEKVRVIKEQSKIVNGTPVLNLVTSTEFKSMSFVFSYYVYSDKAGSVQVAVYTTPNLFERYKDDIADLMDGLEIYK